MSSDRSVYRRGNALYCPVHDLEEVQPEPNSEEGWQWFRIAYDSGTDTLTPKCRKCEQGSNFDTKKKVTQRFRSSPD